MKKGKTVIRGEIEVDKYQGKEVEVTLQAPTEPILQQMIAETRAYTDRLGLEPLEVLMSGADPDGGFKAIIVAHNLNVIKWVGKQKKKWEGRGGGYEARLATSQKRAEEHTKRLEATAEHAKAMSALRARQQAAKQAIRQARLEEAGETSRRIGQAIGTDVAAAQARLATPILVTRAAKKARSTAYRKASII